MSELNLNPKTTAVVVIDLQKGIVNMPVKPHSAETVIANATRLLDTARKAGALVTLVHVGFSQDWGDALKTPVDEPTRLSGELPKDFSDLLPQLNQQPSDIVILKRQWGAFYGTELELQLRRRGIQAIVLCGIATEIGVESTARDAWERGFAMVFAEDAMAGRDGHVNSVTQIFPRLGCVRTTSEIEAALSAAGHA